MPGHDPPDVRPHVSVVVPMFNAAGRVAPLCQRVRTVLRSGDRRHEMILVDDRSTDRTWAEISGVARHAPEVVGLRLADNVGQVGATLAGFAIATGEVVVMMDDDMESDLTELMSFVRAVEAGTDFVSGRRVGGRSALRAIPARLYNARLRRQGFPLHDAGCGFNAMTPAIASALVQRGWSVRQHRFKPTVVQLAARTAEVDVPVVERGSSRYGLLDLAASWLDVELAFGRVSERAYASVAIVGPLAGAAVLAISASSARRARTKAMLGVGAAALTGAAGVAHRTLQLRTLRERIGATRPPWVVAERTSAPTS